MLNPRYANAVADPARCHTRADRDDLANRFMAKRTGKIAR
jgi:hypothetical protein